MRHSKQVYVSQFTCMNSAAFSSPPPTERGSGEHIGRHRGPLQRHARRLPDHNQHARDRTRQRTQQHRAAGPGIQDAAGHQDQAGAGDRDLQEPAGNRGVQVDRVLWEEGFMRPFGPKYTHFIMKICTLALTYCFSSAFPLLLPHSRPISTGKWRVLPQDIT